MDEAHFTHILATLSSNDNDERKKAEAELEQAKATNGSWVLQALCHIVSHEATPEVHTVSLSILRKMFAKDAKFFDVEPPAVQDHIKQSLIAAFSALSQGPQLAMVSACVAACAAKIYLLNNTWNDLWGNLFHSIQDPSANPRIRAASCEVLASCAGVLSPYLRNHHTELASGLISCVQSDSADLKKSAVYALTELINSISTKQLAPFTEIPQHILKSVELCLNTGDNDTAIVLLSNVCELIEGSPALFKTTAEPFLMACMQIASTPAVDSGVRHVAVEVLVVMCTMNTKIIKKINGFATSLFDLLYSYTLNPTIEDNWDVTDDVETAETEGATDFDIGVTSMDRVCCGIGAGPLAAHVQQVVAQGIVNPSWNHRQAAINVLTYSTEGLKTAFVAYLEQAIDMVISLHADENKVVRYAVYQCLSQMCSDFAPDLQMKHHAKVMPILLKGLEDPIPRISAMAASAVNSFFDDAEDGDDDDSNSAKVLAPYVTGTCEALARHINTTTHLFVRSTCLAAMSSVIATGKFSLIPLVQHLVPIFQGILAAPEDPANVSASRMLKCRAIECTTLLAGVSKMEHFGAYAAPVCEYLCQLLSENMPTDDPRLPYVLRGWTNMVDCMQSAVLPYLPMMMPPLLALANLDCDMEMIDRNVGDEMDEQEAEEEGVEKMLMVVPGKGEVLVKTKTSLIEDKTTAMQIVSEIVRALKGELGAYLPQVAACGIEALGFCASTDVRTLGSEILQRLVEAYKVAPSEVPNFVNNAVTALITAVRTELDFSFIPFYLDAIATFAKEFPQYFTEEMLVTMAKILSAVCAEAGKRKQKHFEERKGQMESDDEEELDDAIEEDEELMSNINHACDQILEHCPGFTPLFQQHILPMAGNMLSSDENNALIGMGFVAGFCEFGHNCAAAASLNDIVPPFLHYTTSTNHDLVHSAFNGLRALTLLTTKAYGAENENSIDFARTVMTKIGAFFQRPEAATDVFSGAVTNAISAGLCVLEHYTASIDPAVQTAFINQTVAALPCSADDDVEAQSVHKRILNFFNHPVVTANPSLRDSIIHKLKSAAPDTLSQETVAAIAQL